MRKKIYYIGNHGQRISEAEYNRVKDFAGAIITKNQVQTIDDPTGCASGWIRVESYAADFETAWRHFLRGTAYIYR